MNNAQHMYMYVYTITIARMTKSVPKIIPLAQKCITTVHSDVLLLNKSAAHSVSMTLRT